MEDESKINIKKPEIVPGNITLNDLDISIRLYQMLKSKNILTLKNITDHPKSYFNDKNGFNSYSLKEIEEEVSKRNLTFKPEENN